MPMQQQAMPWLKKVSHAILSEDRVYRYALYRSLDGEAWDAPVCIEDAAGSVIGARKTVCFIMLNPSVADEDANDPTIKKLMKYGLRWDFQRLAVVNLFAYRETDSRKLRALASTRDLVGEENDQTILRVAGDAHKIVCAWGKEGIIQDRGKAVDKMLRFHFRFDLWCLKKNMDGSPVHPLYQPDAAELIEYS